MKDIDDVKGWNRSKARVLKQQCDKRRGEGADRSRVLELCSRKKNRSTAKAGKQLVSRYKNDRCSCSWKDGPAAARKSSMVQIAN